MIRFQPFAPTKLNILKELPVHPEKLNPHKISLVRAVVGKTPKTLRLVEKIFHPGLGSDNHEFKAVQHFVASAHLKKLGVPVAEAMLMPTKDGTRVFFHDPAKGNQKNIFEWADMDDNIRWESQNVSNYEQIRRVIDEHTRTAQTKGFEIHPRAWSIYRDGKTGEWKPIILDFKWIDFVTEKAGSFLDDWSRVEKKLSRMKADLL